MTNELIIRLSFFIGIFIIISLWEIINPRIELTISKVKRWFNNLSIILINSILVRILTPIIPVTIALTSKENDWGLFNNIELNIWLEFFIAFIIFDFIIYLQHLMFHAVPLLWKIHMVHHVDLGIDVTTGLRFHPIEIILSILIKIAAVVVIGPSIVCVIAFEVALNALAMFNHGNIYINTRVDFLLRLFIVTPDMHRVHHSVAIRETNSNFGFNLSCWDRLMGTYRAQPYKGHKDIVIGLSQYRKHVSLFQMMILPFTGNSGNYSINRWGKLPLE